MEHTKPVNLTGRLDQLRVERTCRRHGIELTADQLQLLNGYVSLLLSWNRKVNLVSRLDVDNIWLSHILHSLSPLFLIEIPAACKVLDLGSGGGLPGIPLSIVRPDLQFTHVDSIKKKTAALTDIVRTLGLHNEVINCRAEDLSRCKGSSNRFDLVVARAVAPLDDLVKWSRPLLPKQRDSSGIRRSSNKQDHDKYTITPPALIAMKGGNLGDEIRKARIKTGVKAITELDLVFDGSEELGFEDKKIVIVHLNSS